MPRARPSDLKRKPASREPKTRFTIFCEGKNTEPDYLAAIKRAHRDSIIDIEVIPAAGVPYTQAQAAIQHAKDRGLFKKSRESFERNDQLWVVFDRDDHPRYDEAIALCTAKKIHVARSNPCSSSGSSCITGTTINPATGTKFSHICKPSIQNTMPRVESWRPATLSS